MLKTATIAAATLGLASCLEQPKILRLPDPTPGPQNQPAVPATGPSDTPYSPYFCPTGASYDFAARFCVRSGMALGPFTKAMIAQCQSAGNTKESCEAKDWPVALAKTMRGDGPCPSGAQELGNGFCAEGQEVFGPFARERVEVCKREGGGEPCEWNRWSIFFADLSRTVQTGSVNNPPAQQPETDFAVYLLKAMDEILAADAGLGYSLRVAGQHSRNLRYNGESIFEVGDRSSHCVGMTFQVLVVALNNWYSERKDAKVWNMPTRYLKWTPFKECWYVNAGCHGARDAIVPYGLGIPVKDFPELKPGDFVNYDRTSGYGHSVMFLNFIGADETLSRSYTEGAVGFEYFSSQSSTKGAGKRRAYFDGRCPQNQSAADCGIIKSSLVMGRVAWPASFQPPSADLSLAPRTTTEPGTVPAKLSRN